MPFYEYECPHCRRHTEVLQKISDKPLAKCPECGKKGLRRLISAPVFRLKGSGWYETDFKSDKEGRRNLAGGDDAPAAKDEAGDAKPEAKADAKADAMADAKPEGKPEAKAESKSGPKGEAKSSARKSRPAVPARKAPPRKPAARPAARRPAGKRGKR
jgi:putative FmdB family regulatory protein